MTDEAPARRAAEEAARRSYGKLIAFLAARTRNVAAAEDALSDAFARALATWPTTGVPDNPEGWLFAAARRRLVDAARRARTAEQGVDHQLRVMAEIADAAAQEIPDERLSLMFACAHPAIAVEMRAPLMLQTILGFDAAAIGSAFLVSPAAMGQRLARAKMKIKQAGVPFARPAREDLPDRLDAVLAAVYAAFAEGWADAAGVETRRRGLAEEAIWLGRLLVSLAPDEPEALGLLALMLHAEARRGARRTSDGEYVPLAEQDPAAWSGALIEEAETLLRRAGAMGRPGRYQLEAAIQSAHIERRFNGRTDWSAIEKLYDALAQFTASPVVRINRAIAVAMARGAVDGLAALDDIAIDARLRDYQPYWAARADLAARIGDRDAADAAYERAIGLESDPAVRRFLQRRRDALTSARRD